MNKKIIVAMSGGVDSSTAALLLKRKGYHVEGLFLDFFNDKKSVREVKKVSSKIGIPLESVNVSEEFKKKIIKYFLEELKKGNTPNPCVVCNEEIKFKILLKKMLLLKADCVATGHYARITKNRLFEAKDKNKDQSYFLYRLSQNQIAKILFPLGDYTKVEIRKIAKKFGLPAHDRKESQDICFIPKKGYENFLAKMLSLKKGLIKDQNGKVLGKHDGLPLYTIGQRKGIKIGGNGPYYVIKKDYKKNTLFVGSERELYSQKLRLKSINWIIGEPKFPFRTLLRTRYRNPLVYAIINKDEVKFEKPQRAIAPGQSAVFYSRKGEVIGGGIIV